MPLAAELVGRGSVLLISQAVLYWPCFCCWGCSWFCCRLALGTALWALTWPRPAALSTDVEVGMDFYLLNWHQLALQPEALKNRNIHLNNLCPSNLCNFRNALDEDLCLCLIKQLVCLSLKELCRKIIFKFSGVENLSFVCTQFPTLLLRVQRRDSSPLNSL